MRYLLFALAILMLLLTLMPWDRVVSWSPDPMDGEELMIQREMREVLDGLRDAQQREDKLAEERFQQRRRKLAAEWKRRVDARREELRTLAED